MFKHLNNISLSRAKVILSNIIDSILQDYSPLEDPFHNDKNNIISYYKYCPNDRNIKYINWLYTYKLKYYTISILDFLSDLDKHESKIIYDNSIA